MFVALASLMFERRESVFRSGITFGSRYHTGKKIGAIRSCVMTVCRERTEAWAFFNVAIGIPQMGKVDK
jgi:hypothetical protein